MYRINFTESERSSTSTNAPPQNPQHALIIRLYFDKWMAMPDIPLEAVPDKTPAMDAYFREMMALSNIPFKAGTTRTPEMDAYFKKLNFLRRIPNGTPTFSSPQFLKWVIARPKFCAAYDEFLPTVLLEMDERLQRHEANIQKLGSKFEFSEKNVEKMKQDLEQVKKSKNANEVFIKFMQDGIRNHLGKTKEAELEQKQEDISKVQQGNEVTQEMLSAPTKRLDPSQVHDMVVST